MNIVINCAASIEFNAPLHDNLASNVFGTLNLFNAAKKFNFLENFVQVSTCYVNCDRTGLVEEKIYELEIKDPL